MKMRINAIRARELTENEKIKTIISNICDKIENAANIGVDSVSFYFNQKSKISNIVYILEENGYICKTRINTSYDAMAENSFVLDVSW